MLILASAKLNEDDCPISEQDLGSLHRAEPPDAVATAAALPEAQRARLAVFCYARRHLYALGLRIASTCERAALVNASATAGETLYKQSRDPDKTLAQEAYAPGQRPTKPISLAQFDAT